METLLQSISTELNEIITVNVFQLEKQLRVLEGEDESIIGLNILNSTPSTDTSMPLAELYLPKCLLESDIEGLALRLQITECVLWLVHELCLFPHNRLYITKLLSACFGQKSLSETEIRRLLGLTFRSFFNDIESDTRKPMFPVILAPLCACALDGTELDDDTVTKLGKHLHYFHSAVVLRENPASSFNIGETGKLPLPNMMTENLKRYDILKLALPTYADSSNTSPLHLGAEIPTMKNTKFMLISNPLLAKYMGKGLMLPFVYAKNTINPDGSQMIPKLTIANMYTRARGTEQIPGILDVRRPKNLDLVGRFEYKITEDDLGNKIVLEDSHKNQIKTAMHELFGLDQMDYKPKPLADALVGVKAGDVFVDSFDYNNGHFDLNMVVIPKGSYRRPIEHKSLGKIERTIKLTKPFLMLETKVSSALYNAIQNPKRDLSNLNPTSHQIVAEGMSWLKAADFCNNLSRTVGLNPTYTFTTKSVAGEETENYLGLHPNLANKDILVYFNPLANGYHLPTEAEWEYVALAGTSNPLGTNAATLSEVSKQVFLPMHEKIAPMSNFLHERKPNAWGVADMLGRHLEYCTDINVPIYYVGTDDHALIPQIDPIALLGPNSKSSSRIVKGSPEALTLADISVFNRKVAIENRGFSHNSFRICRSL